MRFFASFFFQVYSVCFVTNTITIRVILFKVLPEYILYLAVKPIPYSGNSVVPTPYLPLY